MLDQLQHPAFAGLTVIGLAQSFPKEISALFYDHCFVGEGCSVNIKISIIHRLFCILILMSLLGWETAIAGGGPFDYTNPEEVRKHLPITEQYHFNSDVRNLRKGMTGSVRADLTYVLNRFPNHHPALNSMARLWRIYQKKGEVPPGEGLNPRETAEYWFDRAIKFAPYDGTVKLLYGIHKQKMGDYDEALRLYKEAEALLPNSADVQYDLGLLYVHFKKYEKALEHARKAYSLGYPLPGLRNILKRKGAWPDSVVNK